MSSPRINLLLLVLVALTSLGIGVLIGHRTNAPGTVAASDTLLRGRGGQFTKPLLLTGFGDPASDRSLDPLKTKLEKEIALMRQEGKISQMSVYYRSGGAQMSINDEEKYFPASLSKVPLMMAYYKLAEHDPGVLSRRGAVDFDAISNIQQEVQPAASPVPGQEYSVEELIEMMILYSDNVGFELLISDPEALSAIEKMLADLQMDYPYKQNVTRDVLTAREYSRFFRVLRNATYINEEYSEKALELLSRADYKNGIVAGVATGVAVSHKYGLDTLLDPDTGELVERQLHDCGIVYHPGNPYLLCIMTKSQAPALGDVESAIATISRLIYEEESK